MTTVDDDFDDLIREAGVFLKQMKSRYGLSLISKTYDPVEEAEATIAAGLKRAGVRAIELQGVRQWLLVGLKPFAEYPPNIEALIQMASLLRSYPVTEYSKALRHDWNLLEFEYSQRYGHFWKGDTAYDILTRERVWLGHLEAIEARSEEFWQASHGLVELSQFRVYPPNLEQFLDAIKAIRKGAPLVESAWLMALSHVPGMQAHPYVRKAMGMVGGHDLRVNSRERDVELRFKDSYRVLLNSPDSVKDIETINAEPIAYESQETLLGLFKR